MRKGSSKNQVRGVVGRLHDAASAGARAIAERRAAAERQALDYLRQQCAPDDGDDLDEEPDERMSDEEGERLLQIFMRMALRKPTDAEVDRAGRELFGTRFGSSISATHEEVERAYEKARQIARERRAQELELEPDD